ncbi:hypothetical protein F2Q68_00010378 [Brassica cretica]|uniref:non-specific serine/threonine protein kinase n=1 Tax=Brassica cretica TaxID=69181 RepID=A0A8S9KWN8_BRACR|nr:hypothetical protein F2Q68_00010378 [Brassica cretica]
MFFKLLTIFFFSLLFQSLQSSSKTLNFIYDGFPQRSYISIQGIAAVTPNGLLRLTNTTVQQTGHAFYNKPIRLKNSPNGTVSSFSTTFVFAIHPRIPGLSGHGIAFVIAPNTRLPYATPSQYMGLFNITSNGNKTNHVFAIELDTIRSTEFNDINDNHVGIDINSLTSVKSSPAGWWDKKGQFNNLTLIGSKPMQVWIDYNGRTHKINVMMGPLNEEKPKKPLVSIVRDLSFVILQDMFVGFSSATGTVPAEHYVLGWSFGVNREAPPLDLSKLPKLPLLHPTRISYFCRFGIPSISIILIFSSIFLVCFIARRRRMFEEELDDWETELGKNRLRFKDLYYATKGFKENDLLGSGGFGRVYKGVMLETNLEIAVKKVSHDSRQGLKEFVSEIVSIGRMSHPNLVPLLGYCRRRGELLLVYEYMPNGSLDKYLYNTPEVTLDWKQRSKVILDVASGLFYLHEDWEQVQTGHAFYNKSIRFRDSPNSTVYSFSTTFVFAIQPHIRLLSGHGIAFVVAPNPSLPYATPSQYMGLFNITSNGNKTNNVFAIELDAIWSTEFNDINDNHVGIDINSLTSVESSPSGWWDKKGQFKNLTLISRKPMQVWVDYNGPTRKIDVTMAPFNEDKPKKPLVSIVRDLSPTLLQDMFVGFSSATGSLQSEHYILGWSFGVNREAPPLDLSKLPKLPPRFRPMKSSLSFYKFGIPLMISFFLIFSLVYFIARRRRQFSEELDEWENGMNRLMFKDLYYATQGFKEKNLLGSGGFGRV